MNWKLTERIVSAFVFLYALVLYVLTVAPTASFWDSGEFIASVHGLQVMHPPGAPFYMLVGRLFSMFVPADYVALSVNLISVLASALTVLLTYWIIVELVRTWQGDPETWTTGDRIAALAGGVIGALTFAATDSFWFNAVEAEVYALSMFFTAAVIWFIMRWQEQARLEEATRTGGRHPFGLAANRYLILIAYLFGLAIGVHLLNLLALFFIALIVFYTEFEKPGWTPRQRWTGLIATGIVSVVAFILIYPGIIQWLPTLAEGFGAPLMFFLLVVAVVTFGVWFTQQRQMPAANLAMLCITMVLIGYSTYALIFIRSAADPPIDLNDPETAEAFVSFLKREQYGDTPLLTGRTYDDRTGTIGSQEVTFPRRWSPDPNHINVYRQYDSDWEFFWDYQVRHMYVRYFLWNFSGKASDVQNAPAITGIDFLDPETNYLPQSPSEQAGRNAYYALPLLLGLIGAGFHFWRDWRRAFAVFILFFITGIGIILYLNQTPMQPRERDYSYVASFFAFSLWVGIGAAGLLELLRDSLHDKAAGLRKGLMLGLGGLLLVAVPVHMTVENYDDHDRSGRYVAPEYAYNMLMSVDENAIIFTNGDNDTYPLWYLQSVENVRPDVRVVNLSLLNTPWYIKQLRDQWAHESPPLPISLTDEQIANLAPTGWQPRQMELPVPNPEQLKASEVFVPGRDTLAIQSPMRWTLEGRPYSKDLNVLYVADLAAYNILRTNAEQGWERPIYFAVTVGDESKLNLHDYFQLEGQAFRVTPIEDDTRSGMGRIVPGLSEEQLKEFKFTNLGDPEVYYDENIRRLVDNYRRIYAQTAQGLIEQGYPEEAEAILDSLMTNVPLSTIPPDEGSLIALANTYQEIGNQDRVLELMQAAEPMVIHRLETARTQRDLTYAAQMVQYIRALYLEAGAFDAAAAFSDKLATALGDDSLRQTPEELRTRYQERSQESTILPDN